MAVTDSTVALSVRDVNVVEWWRPRKELERAQKAHEAKLGYGKFDIRPRKPSATAALEPSIGDLDLDASLSKLTSSVARAARRASVSVGMPLMGASEPSEEAEVAAGAQAQPNGAGARGVGSLDSLRRSAAAGAGEEAEGEEVAAVAAAPDLLDVTEDFPTLIRGIKSEVAHHFEYYHLGSTEGTAVVDQNRSAGEKGGLPSVLAKLLGPVQTFLGGYVILLRAMRRLVNWQDRILTTWAVFLLLALSLVLALIPWAWVLEGLLRLVGLAIFGPHMYWVGKRLARQAEEEAEQEQEYRAASVAQRKAILQERRQRLMEDQQNRLDADLDQQSPMMKYLRRAPHVGVVEELRTSARLKYRWLADPHRSRAFPTNLPQRVVENIYGVEMSRAGPAQRPPAHRGRHP